MRTTCQLVKWYTPPYTEPIRNCVRRPVVHRGLKYITLTLYEFSVRRENRTNERKKKEEDKSCLVPISSLGYGVLTTVSSIVSHRGCIMESQ